MGCNHFLIFFYQGMIEKNALAGVIDTYSSMFRILKERGDEYRLGNKRRVKRKAPVKVKEGRCRYYFTAFGQCI